MKRTARYAASRALSPAELIRRRYGAALSSRANHQVPAATALATDAVEAPPEVSGTLPPRGSVPAPPRVVVPPPVPAIAPPRFAVRMLRSLSFGPTPASIAEFEALSVKSRSQLANWVEWQLDWTSIDDSALDARFAAAGYTTLDKPLTQLWADHVVANPAYGIRMLPATEVQRATWMRAVHSRRQLREMVVAFWHAHFNVTASDFSAGPVFAHYDRDVIRQHAMGNFRAMLEAVATSPSMLYYLDNYINSRSGPNENWARELLELHTLGAGNYYGFTDPFQVPRDPVDPAYPAGYTDIDVYETASAFTGWTLRNGHWEHPAENDGTFVYRQSWHDAGPKFVLGRLLNPEQPDMKDGRDILDRLASHPGTARFICTKLARRFVSDTPHPGLVAGAAEIFRKYWQDPRQIEHVLRYMLTSDHMQFSWGQKVRRPFDLAVAALRAGGSTWFMTPDGARANDFVWRFGSTGHEPFAWAAPNGYPDVAAAWSGSSNIAMTWKFLNWLAETNDNGLALLPILELSRANVPVWTANALVDYWCRRLIGDLPTESQRQVLVRFMAQNGDPATYVIADTDAWAGTDLKRHYNRARLRSMVSLILLSPEFMSR
ncbi:DUF1800 domain-containing protein [Lysobacter humi (ex Lee et al. 2017)]